MIKTAYYRLFYCLYVGLRRSTLASGLALAFITIMMLSILLFWDLIAIACILSVITSHDIYRMIPAEWVMLLFVGLNSLIFLPKKKYLKIEAMFENEEKSIRNRRRLWCVVYIVLSGISVPLMYYVLGKLGLWYYNPT
jgi:hypothetical protein